MSSARRHLGGRALGGGAAACLWACTVSLAPAPDLPSPAPDPRPGQRWNAPIAGALVWVPGGRFEMGAPDGEPGGQPGERPVHEVTVAGRWVTQAEISQSLYELVTGTTPSGFAGCDRCPVDQVSWFDAVHFANTLSTMEGLDPVYAIEGTTVTWQAGADGYRLLTEAEWEHAARGGEPYVHAGSDDPTAVGWVRGSSETTTNPSCTKPANGYGLCDMTGNVREWVWDWAGPYATSPQVDPRGPERGVHRGIRGGSWNSRPWDCRVAYRYSHSPTYRSMALGIRLAREGADIQRY